MWIRRRSFSISIVALFSLLLTGCLSPIAMHRAVLEYDRTVSYVEADLLLLNIARARHHRPVHFTAVSSVAAAFDFRTSAGITGGIGRAPRRLSEPSRWNTPPAWLKIRRSRLSRSPARNSPNAFSGHWMSLMSIAWSDRDST